MVRCCCIGLWLAQDTVAIALETTAEIAGEITREGIHATVATPLFHNIKRQ